jgi:uncharacterized protein YbbC (DUF1343 family)
VGLERLLQEDKSAIDGRRIALICNATSVDSSLRHAADLLKQRPDVRLVALWGPEHGVRGDAQDMVHVDGVPSDPLTQLPVYSLYGQTEASLQPTDEMLRGIDAVVFDVQDVGSRYYTFVWTLALAMRACAKRGVEMIVLDRPNPIGGEAGSIEGASIEPGYESFVGLYPVPNRHGMTAGELALYVNEVHGIGCRLKVVAMEGWCREQYYDDTGLPWVLPSPNMPTQDTALVYPGQCLFEGTALSEGRGATRPFEIFGAPYVDGTRLAEEVVGEPGALEGVRLRPLVFRPTFHKHAGLPCGGLQLHVTDRRRFRPYRTSVALLRAIHRLWPQQFQWRHQPYEFVTEIHAVDLLAGGPWLREGIERGASLHQLTAAWPEQERAFERARAPFLLYGSAAGGAG